LGNIKIIFSLELKTLGSDKLEKERRKYDKQDIWRWTTWISIVGSTIPKIPKYTVGSKV